MSEQVEAIQCGHWTEANEDGTVPLRCDYCFQEQLKDFRERAANGLLTFPPEVIAGLVKAMKCLGIEGQSLNRVKGLLWQLEEPEGE